jgi:hypothetical protein
MSRVNLLKAIPLSFYSKSLYREVRQSWKGRGFIYLLILLAICWLCITIAGTIYISRSRMIGEKIDYITSQMPMIEFRYGVASTSKTGPFFIKQQAGDEKIFLIIDTDNKLQTFEQFKKSSASILMLKDSILMKKGDEVKTLHFSKDFSGYFGPKELKEVFQKIRNTLMVIGILFYPVGLCTLYAFYVLLNLGYGLIGMLFASMFQQKIEYLASLNLAMVAITPTIILCTIIALSSPAILPHALALSSVLSVVYLFFAIRVNV